MSSILKDTRNDLPWNCVVNSTTDMIMWRIAVNLAEIADQLAEMNGYKIDSALEEEKE